LGIVKVRIATPLGRSGLPSPMKRANAQTAQARGTRQTVLEEIFHLFKSICVLSLSVVG
jgi:hypothetical protein